LADQDFEIIAVAQDTGGVSAAGPHYDAASTTFASLVDTAHAITSLYGMINVPSGVWIDEEGNIVRPPEVAYSREWTFGDLTVGDDRYAEAVRDWVENGADSAYVPTAEELRERLAATNPDRPLADAHFKLAVYFHEQGRAESAAKHWQSAQELDPDNWNYHRQEWVFDPETSGGKWMEKFNALEGRPYYDSAVFPASDSD
jgi:tetratricopeptide (TPR) repeat protein